MDIRQPVSFRKAAAGVSGVVLHTEAAAAIEQCAQCAILCSLADLRGPGAVCTSWGYGELAACCLREAPDCAGLLDVLFDGSAREAEHASALWFVALRGTTGMVHTGRCAALLVGLAQRLRTCGRSLHAILPEQPDLLGALQKIDSASERELWLHGVLRRVQAACNSAAGKKQPGVMERAKAFIQDNFVNSELTLKTVANYVGFNEKYFTSGVFGKDPLGLSKDQATTLFTQKRAAITALGDWGLQDIMNGAENVDQLGSFYLPVRMTEDEPFRYIVQGDSFMGVTTHSKNPELAKAFVEWFYSEDWYPGYIDYITSASSMTNFPKEKDPIQAEADAAQPDAEMVLYGGAGDDFTAIQNEIAFDYKKLGAQMFTEGFDLDATLADLDAKWAAARDKLGIQ